MKWGVRFAILSLLLSSGAQNLGAASKASKLSTTGSEYTSALAAADRFLQAWQSGDLESGTVLLTAHAREKVSSEAMERMFLTASPAAYEITHGKQLRAGRYEFPVVLLEDASKAQHAHRRFCSLVVLKTGNNDWAIDKLP